MRCKHSQIVSVITHNRCDPEDCVTAYDTAVGESVHRYTELYLTHRPEVEILNRWPAGSDDRERVTAKNNYFKISCFKRDF